MKIGIAVSKLQVALHGDTITEAERQPLLNLINACKGNTLQLDLTTVPPSILSNLLQEDLSQNQRRAVSLFVIGASDDKSKVLDVEVSTPTEFHNAIAALTSGTDPNVEISINGRWYPVIATSQVSSGFGEGKICILQANYMLCNHQSSFQRYVTDNTFRDDDDNKVVFTVRHLLENLGCRPLACDLRDHFDRVRRADRFLEGNGKMIDVTGYAISIENRSWFRGFDNILLGSEEAPAPCVVENTMEAEQQHHYGNQTKWPLPFVRVFSLERKQYLLVDVDDLQRHVFDADALDKLVLPPKINSMLRTVFNAKTEDLFGDFLKGKSGGMIVLANGGPGVGKTMTAEVFAEHTERPLYVLEMGELGVSLKEVEDNLRRIFRRAARWNAVLLFDEADVFMAQRDDNLERSAIVGVFLRLLDYYKGMLFLTTNRQEVIDKAFRSRITLRLDYPDLCEETRRKIWAAMLKQAEVKLVGDLNGVPNINLNGRQIRNMVRLVRVLHGNSVTPEQIKEVCEFACM